MKDPGGCGGVAPLGPRQPDRGREAPEWAKDGGIRRFGGGPRTIPTGKRARWASRTHEPPPPGETHERTLAAGPSSRHGQGHGPKSSRTLVESFATESTRVSSSDGRPDFELPSQVPSAVRGPSTSSPPSLHFTSRPHRPFPVRKPGHDGAQWPKPEIELATGAEDRIVQVARPPITGLRGGGTAERGALPSPRRSGELYL